RRTSRTQVLYDNSQKKTRIRWRGWDIKPPAGLGAGLGGAFILGRGKQKGLQTTSPPEPMKTPWRAKGSSRRNLRAEVFSSEKARGDSAPRLVDGSGTRRRRPAHRNLARSLEKRASTSCFGKERASSPI